MASSRILALRSDSFLEYAFLRWVLAPAVDEALADTVVPQSEVFIAGHCYFIDYEIVGTEHRFAIELDGFEFHGTRPAFTYDRLRQNDLHASGRLVVRFSYDAIRLDTARCVSQLQALLRLDPALSRMLVPDPVIERPEMDPDPLRSFDPSPARTPTTMQNYVDQARARLNLKTLRACQSEAFAALANYFGAGGKRGACVMSVGAGRRRSESWRVSRLPAGAR